MYCQWKAKDYLALLDQKVALKRRVSHHKLVGNELEKILETVAKKSSKLKSRCIAGSYIPQHMLINTKTESYAFIATVCRKSNC